MITDKLTDDVRKRRVSIATAARLRVAVLVLSVLTVVILVVLGVVTLSKSSCKALGNILPIAHIVIHFRYMY